MQPASLPLVVIEPENIIQPEHFPGSMFLELNIPAGKLFKPAAEFQVRHKSCWQSLQNAGCNFKHLRCIANS
jgi:hypothetical protein